MQLELIRDWETPITKFYKGHYNTDEVWAEILGCDKEEFRDYLMNGTFNDWFKIIA